MLKYFTFFFVLFPFCCFAQFTITGRVLNQADTKPVANATVFLSNATNGDRTEPGGTFTVLNARPGKYQLVISIIGFETYSQPITINNSDIKLPDITIFPKTIALNEVTIKADPKKAKYFNQFYDRFKDEFLGTSDFAKECKILNTYMLDFSFDDSANMLTVSSYGFLEIENNALGYKINYLLKNFSLNTITREIHYEGPVLFAEMKGTQAQEHRWQQNRKLAYEGSMIHFLRSAMNDRLEEEGFRVLQLAKYANPDRPADSLIKAKIQKFDVPRNITLKLGFSPDSLPFWKKKLKLPKTFQTLMPFPLNKGDIITATGKPGIFALGCDTAKLLIIYNKTRHFIETKQLQDLNNLNYILTFRNNSKELTLVNFKEPFAFFDNNGGVIDPNSLVFNGSMARNRVADLLPVNYYEGPQNATDYADTVINAIENKMSAFSSAHIIEKVHLHTDRPWYGPGDTIWFKAYSVAGAHHQLSALSGVLHTELINDQDSVVKRLTLKLDSGISRGDFTLPYTYKSGTYRIRAYTNWMRNDSSYFYDQKVIIGGLKSPPGATFTETNHVATGNVQQSPLGNPDVQFFAEGGGLVNGLRSKVAVKAINKNGLAANITGIITDQDGNEVASFITQYAGMGEFPLTPQQGKQYKAKINFAGGGSYMLDLPRAKDAGFTLTVNNLGDSIYVKVAANDVLYKQNKNTQFYLVAQSGGKYYYTGSSKLADPVFTTQIDKNRFPSGIVQFTLFSQSGEPLNERVIFIQNNDHLKLTASVNEHYAPKEKVKINLEAINEDSRPVAGTFSASVTDETQVPVDEPAESTIFTDLLLTSELKGHIENPDYYFINESEKTRSDLDLLMLTQGYRSFEWKKVLSANNPGIVYQPETSLSLSGTLKTPSNQPIANGKVKLTSIKDFFSADTISDVNGNFTFNNINLPDTTKVIINAKKANGGKNVKITIKQPSYPAVSPVDKETGNYINADTPEPVLTAMRKANTDGRQQKLKNVIQLNEVKVKTRRNEFFNPVLSDNIKFSGNLNGPGNADQVFLGEKLIGCAKLSECLVGKLFGVIWINGLPVSLRASHIRGGAPPMAIFIDGTQTSANALDDINPDDVYSIEVLTSLSYLSIYGSNAPNGALFITLKRGSGAADNTRYAVDGLITYKFNGYHKAREFYSPKYNITNNTPITDQRKTIYWNPDVIAGGDGKASFEYFNAGSKGTYRVVIEGIDGDGNLGRQVFRYKVE
jgi:CarboxypepD_reg-like domain/MG2 domain/TonB-dependent Receptor Plug Domain